MKKNLGIFAALPFTLFCLSNASATSVIEGQSFDVAVTSAGFEPSSIEAKPGVPVQLKVTRKTESTCAMEIVIPSLKKNVKLPLNQTVIVDLGVLKKGEIKFGCAMEMMIAGKIAVK